MGREGLLYDVADTDAVDDALVDVFDHVHGGDYGEVATSGYEFETSDYTLADCLDFTTGSHVVGGCDEGKEIVGGGWITIGYLLHSCIPRYGYLRLTGCLGGVG